MTRNEQRLLFRTFILGVLLTLLVMAMSWVGALTPLERYLYDLRARRCQYFTPPPTDKLIHLDIDDAALETIGKWPWPRSVWAEVIDELRLADSKAVALDIFFSEPDEIDKENDRKLADALRRSGKVVLSAPLNFEASRTVTPLYSAVRDLLKRDLEQKPDEIAASLRAEPLGGSLGPDSISRVFVAARRDAVRQRIEQDFPAEVPDVPELRKKLLPKLDPTISGSQLLSLLREQAEHVRAARELERFSRPLVEGLPPLIEASDDLANLSVLARHAAGIGFVGYRPFDGVVRAMPLWVVNRGRLLPQLGFNLACTMLDVDIRDIQIAPDRIILPRRDGTQIIIPVYTARSDNFDRLGMFIDIPWFGKSGEGAWQTMYDYPRHLESKQHVPFNAVYVICDALRRIRHNNVNVDRAIQDAFFQSEGDLAKYRRNLPAPDDFERRLPAIQSALGEAERWIKEFKGIPDGELTEKQRNDRDNLPPARQVLLAASEQNRVLVREVQQLRTELRDRVQNRAVLVGWIVTGQTDFVVTSLHPHCPGNVIHGAIFNAVMTGELWRHSPPWVSYFATFFAGLLATLCVAGFASPWKGLAGVAALMLAYTGLDGIVLFDWGNRILNPAGPLVALAFVWIGLTLMRFIVERAERRRITRRFQSYVDPTLVNYVIEHPEQVRFDGDEAELSVVFTDLGGFTTLTEKLGRGSVAILNEYMTLMVPIVRKHRGYVNKFLGDGIMFFYNAPLANPNHALDAVDTVMEMQSAMIPFNADLKRRNLPTLTMRAGISSGPMIVGDAGPVEASDYTVLGDAVNLGARLESANKATGTLVMLSGRSAELLGDAYLLRPLGLLRVVGKTEGIMTYTPLAKSDQADEAQRRVAAQSKLIVDHFLAARFEPCLTAVAEFEQEFGSGKFTKLYAELCGGYLLNPPADFDGKIILGEK
jgi:class 3 adenylate cyclase